MAEKTETTQVPEWGNRAVEMARQGKKITEIHKDLDVDYWDVWNHVKEAEGIAGVGWHGAKWIVTHRLNRLAKEKNPTKRQQLVNEAKECANYLYNSGRALSRKIDRVRKELA